jgi:hypothetical protein
MNMTRRKQLEELRNHLLQLRKELEQQKKQLGQLLPPTLEQNLSEIYNSLERTNSELARLPPSEAIALVCCDPNKEIPPFAQQIVLDCCHYYTSQVSSPEFWKKRFWSDLLPLRQKFQAYASSDLALCVSAPLSVSVALGYFAQMHANNPIWIEIDGTWWQTRASEQPLALLSVDLAQKTQHESRCLSIELDLLPHSDCVGSLSDQVTRSIDALDLPINMRYQVRLRHDQALANPRQLQAVSAQLQELLADIRRTYANDPIHLFIAATSSVAVSVGSNLIGFEPFQCYEFSSEQQHFLPTCMIEPVA